MLELWEPVKDYEGYYEISNLGNLRSVTRKVKRSDGVIKTYKSQILKPSVRQGYMNINLFKNSEAKGKSIHRLVAEVFVPNPDNKPIINHIDGNPTNNHFKNLEWCTQAENLIHAQETGLTPKEYHNRPVNQYDLNGRLIATFPSIAQASKGSGISECTIRFFLKGKTKNPRKFIWEDVK